MDKIVIEEAVKNATTPLLRKLEEQSDRLKKLEAQPVPSEARNLFAGSAPGAAGAMKSEPIVERNGRAPGRDEVLSIRGRRYSRSYVSGLDPHSPEARFLRIGRWFAAGQIVSKSRGITMEEVFTKQIPDESLRAIAEQFASEQRILQASEAAGGGVLIPEVLAADVIEALRSKSVVYELGPDVVPMPGGNLSMPREDAAGAANWKGETSTITPTEPTYGAIRLSAKQAVMLTQVSNTMLNRGGPSFESRLGESIVRSLATLVDSAFIRGAGAVYAPRGIRYAVDQTTNVVAVASATTASPNGVDVESDLYLLMGKVQDANNDLGNIGWIISRRTERALMKCRTVNGVPFFPEMKEGMLLGYPYRATTNQPDNLGSGADESEITFGSFSELLVGQEEELRSDFDPTYGFATDTSAIRVISALDCALKHDTAFAVLTGVLWT